MKKQRGFTLIELMIAVAIIGILAAIALPAFLEYMQDGKKSEASLHLRAMETKLKTFRIERGRLPVSTSPTPKIMSSNCVYPRLPESMWAAQPGWLEMGFHIDEDTRYQYSWTPDGMGGGTGVAQGDLNCDGGLTNQMLLLNAEQGNLTATYTDPSTKKPMDPAMDPNLPAADPKATKGDPIPGGDPINPAPGGEPITK